MTSVSPADSSTLAESPGRQTPWSPEAEQAVLGAMLLDNDAALKAAQMLEFADFYQEAHRRIFGAMLGLLEAGKVIDPVILGEELRRRAELEPAGGLEYLAQLSDAVPTAANVDFHCRIVKNKSLLRRLITVGTSIVRSAYEGREDAPSLLDDAEHHVFELSMRRGTQEFTRVKELVWHTVERVEARHRGEEMVGAILTGFRDLDDIITGLQESDLIIVAARPSMGKTALCLNVATHASIVKQEPVGIFSLEMSRDQLIERMLAAESMVDLKRLRSGKLRDEDFPKLARAAGLLAPASMWIDDSPALNLLELRSKARRLKAEFGARLFVIDYLQLLQAPEKSENRQAEISFISRSLKALARELRTPMVVLSQLSRGPEQRGGARRPMLSDLRDSGAIEQDADLVMFIYRQELYKGHISPDEEESAEGVAEVIVAKHRNGPTGTVKLHFQKECARFFDYSDRKPDAVPVARPLGA